MKAEIETAIAALAKKAGEATNVAGSALHLSQSVLNLAHALAMLSEIKHSSTTESSA